MLRFIRRFIPFFGVYLAIHTPFAVAADIFGGRGQDPVGVWREVTGIVDEAAEDLQIAPEVAEAFKARMNLSYDQQAQGKGEHVRRALTGRVSLPGCAGSRNFSFRVESEDPEERLEIDEVIGEYLELALVDFAACSGS
jgi:hypothetical protein